MIKTFLEFFLGLCDGLIDGICWRIIMHIAGLLVCFGISTAAMGGTSILATVLGSGGLISAIIASLLGCLGITGGGGLLATLCGGGLISAIIASLLGCLGIIGGGGLLATVCGGGGLLATILGGCATMMVGGIAGIPVIGGALATICGGILTPLINVISGIPVIGSQLATICGSLASALGCVV